MSAVLLGPEMTRALGGDRNPGQAGRRQAHTDSPDHGATGGRRSLTPPAPPVRLPRLSGAVAQLGERLNGIQEVDGSIPFGSTKVTSTEKTS
jgi:hypothetical protein